MTATVQASRRRKPEKNGTENKELNLTGVQEGKRITKRSRRRDGGKIGRLVLYICLFLCCCFGLSRHPPHFSTKLLVSEFRGHPIEIEYNAEDNVASKARALTYTMHEPAAQGHILNTTPDPPSNDVCQPTHDWHDTFFPSCNNLHEIDMMPRLGSFIFVNCGGDRCAFKIIGNDGTPLALKIRKYRKDFGEHVYASAKRDGQAMERLTASPYVVDLYGYCGLSQLLEFSEGGSIHDLNKIARLKGEDDMDSVDKLKVAIQIVSAVADMHGFEKDGVISLAHNDICCHQYVLINGVYKLNDFHLSRLQKKNRETNQICLEYPNFSWHYALGHAPEEFDKGMVSQEKADVYAAGNVVYYVLTKEWIFEEHSVSTALKLLKKGERSPFPSNLRNSTKRADQAMIKGIEMLWTHNVEERPSAKKVADFMRKELQEIEGTEDLGVVRVANIPPLPPDHRFTDSDYKNNMVG